MKIVFIQTDWECLSPFLITKWASPTLKFKNLLYMSKVITKNYLSKQGRLLSWEIYKQH